MQTYKKELENLLNCDVEISDADSTYKISLSWNSRTDEQNWKSILNTECIEKIHKILNTNRIDVISVDISLKEFENNPSVDNSYYFEHKVVIELTKN